MKTTLFIIGMVLLGLYILKGLNVILQASFGEHLDTGIWMVTLPIAALLFIILAYMFFKESSR